MQRLEDYHLRGIYVGPTTTAASSGRAELYREAARIAAEYRRRRASQPNAEKGRAGSKLVKRNDSLPLLPKGRAGSKLPDGVYRLPNGGRRYVGAEVCAANMFQRKVRAADGGFAALKEVR